MQKSVVVTVPHDLGVETARARVAAGLEQLRRDYVDKLAHSEVAWSDNTAALKIVAFGHAMQARVDVLADSLRIEVWLPWILAALAGPIQATLAHRAGEALQIEHKRKG